MGKGSSIISDGSPATIHQIDSEIRHKGAGKIAAVGILGSDVYDKHLLLEAIKPELPEAVFFTTDLDALLLPHGKFRFTRNLIVASSYGLELTHALQADVAPFRSAYQSSIFLATRLAIRNETANTHKTDLSQKTRDALERWFPRENPRAKVFEIGRSQVQLCRPERYLVNSLILIRISSTIPRLIPLRRTFSSN